MKKRTPRQIRTRSLFILLVGLLIALFGLLPDENVTVIMIGLLTMFASIIHHAVFYRCPHCGKYLDRSSGEYCPGCGRRVNERK